MKSNYIRIILIMAIILLGASLYSKWEIEHQTIQPEQKETKNIPNQNMTDNPVTDNKPSTVNNTNIINTNTQNLITVNTDLYILKISPENGSIVDAYLKEYNTSLTDKSPLELLKNGSYIATSGFLSNQIDKKKLTYSAKKNEYNLGNNNEISVTLQASSGNLNFIKTYIFKKNSYTINVNQTVENKNNNALSGYFYGRIIRSDSGEGSGSSIFDVHSYSTYTGTVLSSTDDHYQKESPSDIKDAKGSSIQISTDQGWSAMVEHYFISAWAPINQKNESFTLFSTSGNNSYSTGAYSPEVTIEPGNSITNNANLYIGPTIKEQLDQAAPNLSLTIDYGWLWFISEIIFWAMSIIYSFVGNWGVAIILVTCLIKLIFFPLSAKSYKSMGRMRLLQPRIKQLKEQFGDDKQGMTKAMMSLYKTEKVNPLGGCLPLVVQIPVFIALYWVLLESVQLRQAPFIFWIHDLAAKDPYYVLPILMGLSMFIQQRLNPAPPDPMQAKIMMFMPVVFTFMFLNFPSGLVLYWLVNNVLSILQQWYIMKNIEKNSKRRKI